MGPELFWGRCGSEMAGRASSRVRLPLGEKQKDTDLCGLPEPELLLVANLELPGSGVIRHRKRRCLPLADAA